MSVSSVVNNLIPEDLAYASKKNSASKELDKDAFLQLFILSLKNQDPTNAQDPTEFMSQMAMFSMVEQMTNLNAQISKMKLATEMDQGTSMIGHTVKISVPSGVSIEGVVEKITAYNGDIKVYLKNNTAGGYDLGRVTEVY